MVFEPKILGFLCNWCSYAGADLAGVSRIQYPTNVRVIRVMCSGRVDPVFIAEAFMNDIDGVLVLGCHLGDCHYISGNYETELKMKMLSKTLSMINFSDRVRLDWVSAAEGNRFAQIVSDFTAHIRKLGPSPVKNKKIKKEIIDNLNAVKFTLCDSRLRALVARQRELTTDGNVYGEIIPTEEFEEILDNAIETEIIRHKILEKVKKEGKSVPDIAKEIDVEPHKVLQHIVTLRARGLVDVDQINEEIPTFISIKEV
ncbi:MAG: hydrogenase iron-sulfur subunit [Candidatus Lokiarchaeota archaeon]|nr:hydrogenase iron-sulfur subunit [Candidatus Lokiarchaeota archaeon]